MGYQVLPMGFQVWAKYQGWGMIRFLVLDMRYGVLGMRYRCFRTLCCKGPPPPRPEYDVVCIGLTGSGKTSLLSRLCNEAADTIVPTTGFSIKAVPFQNAILNVKELGGKQCIRLVFLFFVCIVKTLVKAIHCVTLPYNYVAMIQTSADISA
ncbi:ADP-ribosylation factor-like protein 15 isoform X1 [Tachysurus ichikawai]